MQSFALSYRRAEHSYRDESGFIRIQPDRHGGAEAGGRAYEVLLPFGLYSRPLDPDKPLPQETQGRAAPALVLLESHGDGFAMPLGDARFGSLIPDCGAGGFTLATTLLDGAVKSVASLRIAGAGVDGVTKGTMEMRVPTPSGNMLIKADPGGSGTVTISHPAGGSVVLTSTKATITAPVTVELGGAGGQPPVMSPALLSYLAALNVAITAGVASAGGTFTAPPPPSLAATKVTVL